MGLVSFVVSRPALPVRPDLPTDPGSPAGLATVRGDPATQDAHLALGSFRPGVRWPLPQLGLHTHPCPCLSPTTLPSAGTGRALGTHISSQEEKPQLPPPPPCD